MKTDLIRIRIGVEEKELIRQYCEKYGLNMSNFMRYCTLQAIYEKQQEKNKEENK